MNINDILNLFINNTMEIIDCCILLTFVFKFNFALNVRKIIYVLVFYVLMLLFILFNKAMPVLLFILMTDFILLMVLLISLIDDRLLKKIVFIFLTMILVGFLEEIFNVILHLIGLNNEFLGNVIVLTSISLFIIIANKLFHKSIFTHIDERLSYIYINFIMGVFSGVFPLVIVNSYGNELNKRLNITIIFTAIIIFFATILSAYFYLKKIRENNTYKEEIVLKEQIIQDETKFFMNIVDEYKYLRSFRHDITGHINILYSLASDGRSNDIIEYLNNIQQEMKINALHQCSNTYIAATINQFIQAMDEKKIIFKFTYSVMSEINMESIDICSFFYNLMSNAVEATLKNEGEGVRTITLNMRRVDYSLLVELQNTVHANFDIKELVQGKTSKRDKINHGIGLYNINKVVNKYNGNISYMASENMLKTSIVLANVFD